MIANPHDAERGTERAIAIPHTGRAWRRLFAFFGPAFLVSVGYMDPGNWATDIEGGSRFRYQLLWVIGASNLIALLLQTLAARLGVVTGLDLAQTCRAQFKRPAVVALWLLAEVAIGACDLAEVLGSAIALNLLFHIPLLLAVFITALDVLLLLALQHYGMRIIEAIIVTLIATIAGCYLLEIIMAKPDWGGIGRGLFTPTLNRGNLYLALGILGATVMPHNLYLHSSLVKSRRIADTPQAIRAALRYNFIDTFVALNVAFLVNAAILIMAAAVFFGRPGEVVASIKDAHATLAPLLGGFASTAFAVALLASGQSSTITGTMAGQIVMEGFVHLRMAPALRRLITRSLAILPAVVVISLQSGSGKQQDAAVEHLLVLSQVVLSFQLSFAVIPLVMFTGDRARMGEWVNPTGLKVMAWAIALVIAALNIYLLQTQLADWLHGSRAANGVLVGMGLLILGFAVFVRRYKPQTI